MVEDNRNGDRDTWVDRLLIFNEAIDRKHTVLSGQTKNKENVVGKHTFWTEMNRSSLRTWPVKTSNMWHLLPKKPCAKKY